MKRKSLIASMLIGAGLVAFIGCGGDSGSSSETSKTVVDGYVIDAVVCDAYKHCAKTNANGVATAAFKGSVTAKGGVVDVNGNGVIDDEDIDLGEFLMKAPENSAVVTPVTTLIANGVNPEKLAQAIEVQVEDLYKDPIKTKNVAVAKANQILYAVELAGLTDEVVNTINKSEELDSDTIVAAIVDIANQNGMSDVANYVEKVYEIEAEDPIEIEQAIVEDKKEIKEEYYENYVAEHAEEIEAFNENISNMNETTENVTNENMTNENVTE